MMTTKRSAEGPYSLAYALYHARSFELCTFKKFYVGGKKSVHNYFIHQPKPDVTGIHHPAPRQPCVHSEDDRIMAVCNCQLLSVHAQGRFQST